MQILIANGDLKAEGGTETWCGTLAYQYSRREGHDVDIYAPRFGNFADDIARLAGARLVEAKQLRDRYDFILSNHAAKTFPNVLGRGTLVLTSHSTYHPLEQPVEGADYYVAATGEVFAGRPGFFHAKIQNPIDVTLYAPSMQDKEGDLRVVALTKSEDAADMVRQALAATGSPYSLTWARGATPHQVADLLRKAHVCVSYGRGALEGLASGCAVFSFDCRPDTRADHRQTARPVPLGDGWINNGNVLDRAFYNFSGRSTWWKWDVSKLQKAFADTEESLDHMAMSCLWGPRYVSSHHDAAKIAKQYRSLALHGRAR